MGADKFFKFYFLIFVFCFVYFSREAIWAKDDNQAGGSRAAKIGEIVVCDLALSWLAEGWLKRFSAPIKSPERTILQPQELALRNPRGVNAEQYMLIKDMRFFHLHISEVLNYYLSLLQPRGIFHGFTASRTTFIRVNVADYGYAQNTGAIDMPLEFWLESIFRTRNGFSFSRNKTFATDFTITKLEPQAAADIPKLRLVEVKFNPPTFVYFVDK